MSEFKKTLQNHKNRLIQLVVHYTGMKILQKSLTEKE